MSPARTEWVAAFRAASSDCDLQLMDTWRGHFRITHFVLQALLKKKADAQTADFSRTEGVLFNACEFWAAVATRELARYLGVSSAPRLFAAFEAFSEIQAVRVASALRIAIVDWPEEPSANELQQRTVELEARLLDTEDAVDLLIAQYATENLTNSTTEGKQPIASRMPSFTGLGE